MYLSTPFPYENEGGWYWLFKYLKHCEAMKNKEELREASHDAVRALERERERYAEKVAEIDGYLRVVNGVDDVLAENERLSEELESMRAMYDEEKALRTKLELELNEMKKLSVGVAKKSSQEEVIKAVSTFVNKSKQKRIEKRTMVKSIVLEFAMTNGLTLPEELMQTIDALDDERVEPKVVNVSGNYNDIHENRMVSNV